ncbi:hypothetical protein [Nocardioides massiliensis]|uniref:Transcription factor zinc-finger domain-containing protein n=1 Tax=Nocardioides massiliensis TaxID=1325935 RepID=A0ABT9NIY0_9ACTN|nr:hypothetical protein [Nocardioides massiliensis]MDP9820372.1 hypothetical protein [Nocardioides massiliensis]
MANVIEFTSSGGAGSVSYDGLTCPECDGAWFTVQAVVLDRESRVTGYAAPTACRDCGHVVVAGTWAAPPIELLHDERGDD